jgi:hypothetical protein
MTEAIAPNDGKITIVPGRAKVTNIWIGNAAEPDNPAAPDVFNKYSFTDKLFFNLVTEQPGSLIVGVEIDGIQYYAIDPAKWDQCTDIRNEDSPYYRENGKAYFISMPTARRTAGDHGIQFRTGHKVYPVGWLQRNGLVSPPVIWDYVSPVFPFKVV